MYRNVSYATSILLLGMELPNSRNWHEGIGLRTFYRSQGTYNVTSTRANHAIVSTRGDAPPLTGTFANPSAFDRFMSATMSRASALTTWAVARAVIDKLILSVWAASCAAPSIYSLAQSSVLMLLIEAFALLTSTSTTSSSLLSEDMHGYD
jgi:hypothetical protein